MYRAVLALIGLFAAAACAGGGSNELECPGALLNSSLGNSAWPKLYGDAANRSGVNGPGPTVGAQRFEFMVGSPVAFPILGESPGRVYLALGTNGLRAIDDQVSAWTYSQTVNATPAVGQNGIVYVVTDNGTVAALDPDTGVPLWTQTVPTPVGAGINLAPGGLIVVPSQNQVTVFDSSGVLIWTEPVAGLVGVPVIGFEGDVIVTEASGRVRSLTRIGAERWRYQSPSAPARPPVVDGACIVYFATDSNTLTAVRPQGLVRWSIDLPGPADAPPVLAPSGDLYVSAGGELILITRFGTIRPRLTIDRPAAMAIDGNGRLIVSDVNGQVSAIDEPGLVRWTFDTGDVAGARLALPADGGALLGTNDGRLIRIE